MDLASPVGPVSRPAPAQKYVAGTCLRATRNRSVSEAVREMADFPAVVKNRGGNT